MGREGEEGEEGSSMAVISWSYYQMDTHGTAKARASAVSESPSLLSAHIESPLPVARGWD